MTSRADRIGSFGMGRNLYRCGKNLSGGRNFDVKEHISNKNTYSCQKAGLNDKGCRNGFEISGTKHFIHIRPCCH